MLQKGEAKALCAELALSSDKTKDRHWPTKITAVFSLAPSQGPPFSVWLLCKQGERPWLGLCAQVTRAEQNQQRWCLPQDHGTEGYSAASLDFLFLLHPHSISTHGVSSTANSINAAVSGTAAFPAAGLLLFRINVISNCSMVFLCCLHGRSLSDQIFVSHQGFVV